MGDRTRSYIDVEKQQDLKARFLIEEKDNQTKRRQDEQEFNTIISAMKLEATLSSDEDIKIEIPTANRKRKESKDRSESESDSEEGCDKRKVSNSCLHQEYLLNLSYSDIYEKSRQFSDDSFLVLMKVLNSIFEGKSVSEKDLAFLSKHELTLLSAFFSKKYKVSFSCSDKLKMVAELINCHKFSYKHKRNEENYKLVFKKAIKHLTRLFRRQNPETRGDKKKLLIGFYRHYFRDEFIKKGLDKEFDLPRHDENRLAENFNTLIYNPKTVNPKYISMVANSRLFITDVIRYINDAFMSDYVKSRFSKVERILINSKDIVKLATHSGNRNDLVVKIENNPRFKLPWYNEELQRALKCVKVYLISKCEVSPLQFKY